MNSRRQSKEVDIAIALAKLQSLIQLNRSDQLVGKRFAVT
jgi:hypothetical protein